MTPRSKPASGTAAKARQGKSAGDPAQQPLSRRGMILAGLVASAGALALGRLAPEWLFGLSRAEPRPQNLAAFPMTPPPPAAAEMAADPAFVDEEPLPAEALAPPPAAVPARPGPATPGLPAAERPPADRPLWRQQARPAIDTGSRPAIAIVIDDLGIDHRRTDRTIALPGEVTLAFMTYANDLARQTARAQAARHELLVHVPMQPMGAADPGPNALTEGLPRAELQRRLRWGLERFEGYVGINNHMGSRFTADPDGMRLVMDELRQRGLAFVDSRTSERSTGAQIAAASGVTNLSRNLFLDNVDEIGAVRRQLVALEAMAHRHGSAIAIGHPRDATLAALEGWLPGATAAGLTLVPISTLLRRQAV